MTNLDQASPEEHRARYEALKANATARRHATKDRADIQPISDVVLREIVPHGAYANLRIGRFQSLRLVDPSGTACVSFMAWNADDTSERYNAGDTVKLQWTAHLTAGRLLFSDMGRVIASIIADTAAGHDALIGGAKRSGRNARDNLVLAAAKFGLGGADVPTPIAFFAALGTDETGRFVWVGQSQPGRLVELRAEMNLLVAISNTSHPLDPQPGHAPIEAIVWRSQHPAADDPARHGGEEAERGFENTDRSFEAAR